MAYSGAAAAFKAALDKLPPAVKAELDAAVYQQALALADFMKSVVPVKSGALRNSIRVERMRTRTLSFRITAGGPLTTRPVRKGAKATYDYAKAQEFGTRKMKRQPFFFPSYRLKKKDISNAARKATKAAVEKTFGKTT